MAKDSEKDPHFDKKNENSFRDNKSKFKRTRDSVMTFQASREDSRHTNIIPTDYNQQIIQINEQNSNKLDEKNGIDSKGKILHLNRLSNILYHQDNKDDKEHINP